MGTLDVDSLFTNIPLEETIEISTNELFKESETVEGLSKTEFKELLSLATKDSHFIFDGTLYKQIDVAATGFPLGPTLANAFLVYHEKNWLEHCPVEYRPLYYRRYVDDIFVLFNSSEHLKRFYSYLNSRHLNISLTMENEKGNRMSFLDVNIIREKDKFTTSVYRKPTFSRVYAHFDSFLPFSSAETIDMEDYTKPTKRDFNPDLYIIHIGTNDLSLDDTPEVISSRIIDTAKSLMTEKNKVVISNIVPRGDKYKEKGEILSKVLNEACSKENIPVINHNNINPKRHLNRSKLHFNNYGNSIFVKNIRNFLSNLI